MPCAHFHLFPTIICNLCLIIYHLSVAAKGFSPENAIHFPRYPQKWRDSREFCSLWLEFYLQVKMSRNCNLLSRNCSLSWLSGNNIYQMVSPGWVWGNRSVQSAIFDPATGLSINHEVTALENASMKARRTWRGCVCLNFLCHTGFHKTCFKRFGSIMFLHTAVSKVWAV